MLYKCGPEHISLQLVRVEVFFAGEADALSENAGVLKETPSLLRRLLYNHAALLETALLKIVR